MYASAGRVSRAMAFHDVWQELENGPASGTDHADAVLRWLDAGASQADFDVNATDANGMTLLHRACLAGYADAVAALLRCDVDTGRPLRSRSRGPHDSALRAVRANTLSSGTLWPGAETPLHGAVRAGRADIVRMLLLAGHAKPRLRDYAGRTALELAVRGGAILLMPSRSLEVVVLLLSKGDEPPPHILGSLMAPPGLGLAAVDPAANAADRALSVDIVRVLVNAGADAHAHLADGGTLLMQAAAFGFPEMVTCLLDLGVDPNSTTRNEGLSALTVVAMMAEAGEDLDGPPNRARLAAAAELIARGADVDLVDMQGNSAMTFCCFVRQDRLMRMLMDAGASTSPASTHPEGRRVRFTIPMLSIAVSEGGGVAVVRTLLEYGADVHEPDSSGFSPLLRACEDASVRPSVLLEMVELLLDFGADPNTMVNSGFSALTACARHDHVDAAKLLLSRGASLSTAAQNNSTDPLLCAARNGSVQMVRLLVERGAPVVSEADSFDATTECRKHHPLGEAQSYGHNRLCDECGISFAGPYTFAHCAECDFDVCKGCQEDQTGGASPLKYARSAGHEDVERLLVFAEESPVAELLKQAGLWSLLFKVMDMGIETVEDTHGVTLRDFTATLAFTAQEAQALLDAFNEANGGKCGGASNGPRRAAAAKGRPWLFKSLSRRFSK